MPYSQNDEEKVILERFAGRKSGRVLDIGAFDGSNFSNSRALIDLGWEGVLVEPSPWPFSAAAKLYWNNPKVTLINAAIVPEDQGRGLHLMKFLATEDAVSCQEERTAQLWGREKYRTIWVRPMTPSALPPGDYEFITIDVEDGTMPLVLDLIARTKLLQSAALVCLEHTAGGVTCRKEMVTAMEGIGKKVIHTTGENYLFA